MRKSREEISFHFISYLFSHINRFKYIKNAIDTIIVVNYKYNKKKQTERTLIRPRIAQKATRAFFPLGSLKQDKNKTTKR